jgi:hypothetical protein
MRLLHRNCAQWKREQISRFHWRDLIRMTVQLGQSFAFHLQFHLDDDTNADGEGSRRK